MLALISIFTLMAILSVLYIALPLFKKQGFTLDKTRQQNIEIAKQRRQEFYDQGASDEEIATIEQELATLLADDLTKLDIQTETKKLPVYVRIIILALVPIMGTLIYTYTGSTAFLNQPLTSENIDNSSADIQTLVKKLEQKLTQQPENKQGWLLAVTIYQQLENYQKAAAAYQQLNRLEPNNPDYLVGWANSNIMSNNKFPTEAALQRLQQALQIDPNHVNALWLAGLSSQTRGENDQAREYFLKLLPLVADDDNATERLNALLGNTQENTLNNKTNSTARTIAVEVSLSNALQQRLPSNSQVFIIAKRQAETNIPLAVAKYPTTELPLSIQLTESMAMIDNLSIADFDDILVYARISLKGDATPQAGDFISNKVNVDVEQSNKVYPLIINKILH